MQIFKQKYAVEHKEVQSILKIRTPCYKQVANKRGIFARLRSQNQAVGFRPRMERIERILLCVLGQQ